MVIGGLMCGRVKSDDTSSCLLAYQSGRALENVDARACIHARLAWERGEHRP